MEVGAPFSDDPGAAELAILSAWRNTADWQRLLEAFLAFWRRHGQPLLNSAPYHEIAPHLVLMAFLHRVANAGGTLEREYAIGSGRMDLCLRYGPVLSGAEGPDTLAMELKVWRDGRGDPLQEGLEQLDGYLGGLGLESGWLSRSSNTISASRRPVTASHSGAVSSGRMEVSSRNVRTVGLWRLSTSSARKSKT